MTLNSKLFCLNVEYGTYFPTHSTFTHQFSLIQLLAIIEHLNVYKRMLNLYGEQFSSDINFSAEKKERQQQSNRKHTKKGARKQ